MNRTHLLPMLFSAALFSATSSLAQIRDLTTLQEHRAILTQATDSLMSVRIRFVALRDSLSSRADSLWGQDPESTELLHTRSASRMLVARLQVIERELDSLAAGSDSLETGLRDSYDWEIARLHGFLTKDGWDEGLFRQLLVFQEEREGLGNSISFNHRFDGDHELSIDPDDGPEELRQKIEFAQDKVADLQVAEHEIKRQLREVDTYVRMMQKFRHVTDEMARTNGADAELLRRRLLGGGRTPRMNLGADGEPVLRIGARTRTARSDSSMPPLEAPWLLEGQRLKAKAQELNEVEAVLQERIAVFHEHLSGLLEGGE